MDLLNVPQRYIPKGLSKKDRQKQIRSIKKSKRYYTKKNIFQDLH